METGIRVSTEERDFTRARFIKDGGQCKGCLFRMKICTAMHDGILVSVCPGLPLIEFKISSVFAKIVLPEDLFL